MSRPVPTACGPARQGRPTAVVALVGAALAVGATACESDCEYGGEAAFALTQARSGATGLADSQVRPGRTTCSAGVVLVTGDRKVLVVRDHTPADLLFEVNLDVGDDGLGEKMPHSPTTPGQRLEPPRAYLKINDVRPVVGRCYQTQDSFDPGTGLGQLSTGQILITANGKAAGERLVGTFRDLHLFSCSDGAELTVSGSFSGLIPR